MGMKPFLFSRLPSGERPPFKKVRSFVRQTTPGSDKPGLRRESSEFTLLIEDKEMKNTVTLALDKLQQNRRAEEVDTRGGRDWSMRQVTPTWVDGRKLDPSSNAWTTWSALQSLRLWANPRATFATCNLPRRRPPESAKGG